MWGQVQQSLQAAELVSNLGADSRLSRPSLSTALFWPERAKKRTVNIWTPIINGLGVAEEAVERLLEP